MATDYRYNQFDDVLETVEKTELHVVPSVSPFIVTLDEVPERGDPTTMTVKEVTGVSEGARIYGRTFTEVAETPTSGTFRPDYNTGANGDATWNTGALLFSSSDANAVVEITYQATGSVASLRSSHYPAWWTDRGDGSDGDFYPTEDTTISGVKNYRSVYIPEGVTVKVNRAVHIKCLGAFVNHGTLTATGEGAAGGVAEKRGTDNDGNPITKAAEVPPEQGFVAVGAAGGSKNNGTYQANAGTIALNMPKEIWQGILTTQGIVAFGYGSGGGGGWNNSTSAGADGGAGGGVILIAAADALNTATIDADGNPGENGTKNYIAGGGGGGGGTVAIVAHRVTNTGAITAEGGTGGTVNNTKYAGVGADGESGLVFTKEVDV